MEENFVNEIIDLYKANRWSDMINKYHNHSERNKLLWVFPSDDNLNFIKTVLKETACNNVLSIGCGSGLLEWIITKATGIPVEGLEIDGAWWRCKYSPPTFIPLLFTIPDLGEDTIALLQSTKCLLFCYFNNRPAFNDYIQYFTGDILIIIGPGEGKGVHTDPMPFNDLDSNWVLFKHQEVRDSKDFIAVYRKNIHILE